MIRYEAIHHVSVAVTDLKKAKAFYGSVLGLEEIDRPPFDFPGAWYQVGNQQIHLIVHEPAVTRRKTTALDTRDGHVALRVKDDRATAAWLKQQGVEILEKPNSTSGFAQIFCCDPDGNLIELHVDQADLNNKQKGM
ncbi:VOC family protein [Laceyella putida]|uniref:VOC family protein n=1 Tax=Laceyella putida TaxID=110101 RepID=A0ABW2RNI8_9BACL